MRCHKHQRQQRGRWQQQNQGKDWSDSGPQGTKAPGSHFVLQLFRRFCIRKLSLHPTSHISFISHQRPEMGRSGSFPWTITDHSLHSIDNLSFMAKVIGGTFMRKAWGLLQRCLAWKRELLNRKAIPIASQISSWTVCKEIKHQSHLEHHLPSRWISKQDAEESKRGADKQQKQQLETMWQEMTSCKQVQRLTVNRASNNGLNKTITHHLRTESVRYFTVHIWDYHLLNGRNQPGFFGRGWPSHFSSDFFLFKLLHLLQLTLSAQKALAGSPSSISRSLKVSISHYQPNT